VHHPLDVVAVGNALVDVLASGDDGFLAEHGMVKGAMVLIDADQADRLYAAMGPAVEMSGGSAANTAVGVASLGGEAAFVGRVHDDQLGAVFAHDVRAAGVEFPNQPVAHGSATGRSLIVVTADAERTMGTFLGASGELTSDDVPDAVVGRAALTFLEGYMFDRPAARQAYFAAAAAAHGARRRVALTLSDVFCVERHRDEFRRLVAEQVDVLFANELELCRLYEVVEPDDALASAADHCETVVMTRSERGSVVLSAGARVAVPAHPVERVVDSTGAGDLYAAGFLFGLARSYDAELCGRLGSLAAAEVISHVGARPVASLADLAAPLLP
jgi:sugar/nucleoside kinase (ribokinase family)